MGPVAQLVLLRTWLAIQRGKHAAQGAYLKMVPAGFRQHAAQGPPRGIGARFGKKIALGLQHSLKMRDQPFKFVLRGRW